MSEDEEQDYSLHASPEECAESETVVFDDDGYVMQGEKIALTAECDVCGRKFERIWYFSHDECYEPDRDDVCILIPPHATPAGHPRPS